MEIEEFTALVHITQNLGLISPFVAEEVLAHTRISNSKFIDPKILTENNHLTDWQISKIVAGDGTMLLFNGYHLLFPIGPGKLGRTYKARKIDTGELVALKVLRKRHANNNVEILKFLRQGEILKDINHPNIVKTLDLFPGTKNIPPYLSLEWMKGGSVYDWLEIKTFLSCTEACLIMEELSKGFLFLQKMGISHGNFSGAKVLLYNPSHPKINNFRFGSIFDTQTGQINNQNSLSFDYAGLAKHSGESSGPSQSDIFFAGCLFYHLLTGKSLLPGSYQKRKEMYNKNEFKFIFNTEFEKTLPSETLPIIKNMISIDPKSRYSDFLQVQIAIQSIRKKIQAEYGVNPSENGSTIFLVIRNDKKRQLIKAYMQNRGFRILQANNLEQALTVYNREHFKHLIIELDSYLSIKETFSKMIIESELCRRFLHTIFLVGKKKPLHIPARNGNTFIETPIDFSLVMEKIMAHEKS